MINEFQYLSAPQFDRPVEWGGNKQVGEVQRPCSCVAVDPCDGPMVAFKHLTDARFAVGHKYQTRSVAEGCFKFSCSVLRQFWSSVSSLSHFQLLHGMLLCWVDINTFDPVIFGRVAKVCATPQPHVAELLLNWGSDN